MPDSVALLPQPGTPLTAAQPAPPFGRLPDERLRRSQVIGMAIIHVMPVFALFSGVTRRAAIMCFALWFIRMFFITAGYHRYFSHRSYKTNRVFQFVLAFGGGMSAQKGALWWASNHRHHHRTSDTIEDLHSPTKGFWWAHVGWILCKRSEPTLWDSIGDFAKYPELRFLNKHDWIPPWTLGFFCFFYGGLSGLWIGFFLSTVILWHTTFLVNSATHLLGRRRYATTDTSRNSAIIALLTHGEGWHNNHHYYQASVRQGFYWWEFDVSYYILKVLSWLRIVRDLKLPTDKIRNTARIDNGAFDVGMYRDHLRKASKLVAAAAITPDSALPHAQTQVAMDTAWAYADDLSATTRRIKPTASSS